MSAPKTDLDKQEQKHRPSLLGIKAVLIYATILLAAFIIWVVANGGEPEESGTMIDGRTGEETNTGN